MSYTLAKPYTDKQKSDFIVAHNHNNGLIIKETETALYALESNEIMGEDNIPVINPNYETEQAQKEAARIALLNLTAADVERAIYKAKGIDFEDVITQLEAIPLAEGQAPVVDIKALKIELKANNFYRGNPYIDTVGTLLGFTKEQLDEFFEAANTDDGKADAYKYLTTVTLTINPTPADATVTIGNAAVNTLAVPYGTTLDWVVSKDGYITQSGSVELTEDTLLEIELVAAPAEEGKTETEEVEG